MSREFVDPWVAANASGPWTARLERSQEPCHYCKGMTHLKEPGKPWKAHKTCASGEFSSGPLGDFDGEEHKAVPDGPFGCGEPREDNGRSCGGLGTQLSCQLCPKSPTYWREAKS